MKATNRTSIAWIPRRRVQAIVAEIGAEIGAVIVADVADDPAAGVIVVVATDEVDMVVGTVMVVTAAGVTRIVFCDKTQLSQESSGKKGRRMKIAALQVLVNQNPFTSLSSEWEEKT